MSKYGKYVRPNCFIHNVVFTLTLRAKPSRKAWFGGGDVSQAERAFIKILICEQMSQAHFGCIICNVNAKLLQGEDKMTIFTTIIEQLFIRDLNL